MHVTALSGSCLAGRAKQPPFALPDSIALQHHLRTIPSLYHSRNTPAICSIMAAVVKGTVSYKKKEGTLALSGSQDEVTWVPMVPGAAPSLTIPIPSITSESRLFSNCSRLLGYEANRISTTALTRFTSYTCYVYKLYDEDFSISARWICLGIQI